MAENQDYTLFWPNGKISVVNVGQMASFVLDPKSWVSFLGLLLKKQEVARMRYYERGQCQEIRVVRYSATDDRTYESLA